MAFEKRGNIISIVRTEILTGNPPKMYKIELRDLGKEQMKTMSKKLREEFKETMQNRGTV